MALPEHVHRVTARGRVYFYYQRGRGTDGAATRVRLPDDPQSPEFWSAYKALHGPARAAEIRKKFPAKSIGALIFAFAGSIDVPDSGSPEWKALADSTQINYRIYLDRMELAWGALPACALTPAIILAARDEMSETPFAANSFLATGKTMFRWGIPREFADANPFREVARLDTGDAGHIPWPEWAWRYVIDHAPDDVARFVFLALHTGQREVDVLRLGPADREGAGIWTKPKKTGRLRGRIWIGLTATALIEIQRIEREPAIFVNPRFKAPVSIETGENFVFSPRGRAYNTDAFRSRWLRWHKTPSGKALLAKWSDYVRLLAERAGEEFDEEEKVRPALRGSAVVIRRMAGATHQQISNDIGMSIQMVMHYTRFMDQKLAAESNIVLLEEAERRKKAGPK